MNLLDTHPRCFAFTLGSAQYVTVNLKGIQSKRINFTLQALTGTVRVQRGRKKSSLPLATGVGRLQTDRLDQVVVCNQALAAANWLTILKRNGKQRFIGSRRQ